ncbi:unnamed protein product, partial [Vitis vinifera]
MDVKVRIRYDGEVLRVFVGEDTSSPAISDSLNFSIYLRHKVYVGFSASTGNYSQLNYVRSWEFSVLDLDDHQMPQWIWIIVAAVIALFIGFAFSLYWKWKYYVRKGDDPGFELQIQGLSTAPRKFRLKELESATENFNSDNLLGRGGFGTVYKGALDYLHNGCEKRVLHRDIKASNVMLDSEFNARLGDFGLARTINPMDWVWENYRGGSILDVVDLQLNGIFSKEQAEYSMLSHDFLRFNAVALATVLVGAVTQAECFNFSYPIFKPQKGDDLTFFGDSYMASDTIQLTQNVLNNGGCGRVFYTRPLKLWSTGRGTLPFNSTFVINITPLTYPGGEGLAFILTGHADIPANSVGKWLGIISENTMGSSTRGAVAVEFDTRNSYPEDLDDNHVGLDLNSIYSRKQESLSVNLSSGIDIKVKVQYDGQGLSIFVGENRSVPVIFESLNLYDYLPQKVYVGFSASTGVYAQINYVKSWEFSGLELYDDAPNLLWVWITVPGAIGLVIGFSAFLYWKWQRKTKDHVEEEDDPGWFELQIQGSSTAPRKFKLKELEAATENFNSDNLLGRGGFGTVYKGVLRVLHRDIKASNVMLDSDILDVVDLQLNGVFSKEQAECVLVLALASCHPNPFQRPSMRTALRVLAGEVAPPVIPMDRPAFVTETNPIALDWEKRHSIIRGVAQALDYLHNGCQDRVLHRDIKTSNIMLDSEFNARLGDFGLARTIHPNDQTHHSTQVLAGTHGYMAPESFHNSRATVETDVYAFGVLLLEVVCARKPGTQSMENDYNNSIVDWVWAHHRRDRLFEVVDFRLNGDFNREQVECVLMLALACCHPNPYERPSMRTALRVLTGEVDPPLIPFDKPVFMWPATAPPSFNEDLEYCSFMFFIS